MKKAVFVTGTDTGVGKTVITGLLARYLQSRGLNVITQKWVQTGSGLSGSDVQTHLKIMGRRFKEVSDISRLIAPYVFKLPASPHLAAASERKKISHRKIIYSFKALLRRFDFVLVEGAGGVMVPLNRKSLMIDIVKMLNMPVLLVCPNRLGAINQALLAIGALKRLKLKILGVIFINSPGQNKKIIKDNPEIIRRFSGINILGILPWNKNHRYLYRRFLPAAGKIEKALK